MLLHEGMQSIFPEFVHFFQFPYNENWLPVGLGHGAPGSDTQLFNTYYASAASWSSVQ